MAKGNSRVNISGWLQVLVGIASIVVTVAIAGAGVSIVVGSRNSPTTVTITTTPPRHPPPKHGAKYLALIRAPGGATPARGLATIGGIPYAHSLYYDTKDDGSDDFVTHYNIGGNWSRFTASVGIQIDPSAGFPGTCGSYNDEIEGSPSWQVFADGNRIGSGALKCDSVIPLSFNVEHVRDLELELTTGPCYDSCSGYLTWGNARLKR
jgi:hypothetical protein